jgi:vacuolar iron transporter family protein
MGHPKHRERHGSHHSGWLRASVLGANDGIVSTASLILGVIAAGATHANILSAGIAALVAGTMSMAAGEYVSVSSQADTEKADFLREAKELETDPDHELAELTAIYVSRGLTKETASEVARQLTAYDALGSHARDELGISETLAAKPVQAAIASALSFAAGAALPLLIALLLPAQYLQLGIAGGSIALLAILGVCAAYVGQASMHVAALRVMFWGTFAMSVTWGVGWYFGH